MAMRVGLRFKAVKKNILIYPGMPTHELKTVICAAFGISDQAVGLCDPSEDVYYPIALLSQAPSFFSSQPFYELSVLPEDFGGDEEDDDDEDDGVAQADDTDTEMLFHLDHSQTRRLMEAFSEATTDGSLDRATFERVFETALGTERASFTRPMRKMLSQLFDLFDRDCDGAVDAREFQTGLAVLGRGSEGGGSPAIRHAFEAYDLDGNGFISLDEMSKYLTSVFSVISKSSSEVFVRNGVTPEELGEATALRCFEELGIEEDGRLGFEQFQEWYSSPDSKGLRDLEKRTHSIDETSELPSLEELREITGLGDLDPNEVFAAFKNELASDTISSQEFLRCFELIKPAYSFSSEGEYAANAKLLEKLFHVFDTDKNGTVDFGELASGLSVLCGGSRDDKVRAAFQLFDTNGDGAITKDEMVTYLKSVFKVVYETSAPETRELASASPELLALATAEECFADADLDDDGCLSFDEFRAWYLAEGPVGMGSEATVAINKIEEFKQLTNIEAYDISTLLRFFSEQASDNGYLTRTAFFESFAVLIHRNNEGVELPEHVRERILELLDFVYRMFDTDMNGVVDLSEMGAGLSVLCGGSRDDKVVAAFALYDDDGDGFISLEELVKYLTSVYKMLFESSPETRDAVGVSPLELATTTATQCFDDADTNSDGRISFDEFKAWYMRPVSSDANNSDDMGIDEEDENMAAADQSFSLQEMSELTHLEHAHVDTVFQMLAHCSSKDGVLSHAAFNGCFRALMGVQGSASEYGAMVVDTLFAVFDPSGEGFVSFDELASGLTVLCGGNQEDKIKAAFGLFDLAGTGYITKDEMTIYLASVFTVLYVSSPETKMRLNISPYELASLTTDEAFLALGEEPGDRMSFVDFKEWCSSNGPFDRALPEDNSPSAGVRRILSLEEIRSMSGLGTMNVDEVFNKFAESADDSGVIARSAFDTCMSDILHHSSNLTPGDRDRLVDELFDLFDADDNGMVDFVELASGLSVLCGGSRDDKVRAAFELFDTNGDGSISKDEMATYLTSVFKLIFGTRPELEETLGVGPAELSAATTDQAFADADLDSDGTITFSEFKEWYFHGGGDQISAMHGSIDEEITLDVVREATGLHEFDVDTVFALFADAAGADGSISEASFDKCFRLIAEKSGSSQGQLKLLDAALAKLFMLFDTDGSGRVDATELLCGLTVFCGGNRDKKVKAAFDLIDTDRNGYISRNEMCTYLTSVFKVLHEMNSRTSEIDAEILAEATTNEAFSQAALTMEGQINLEEFTKWYSQTPDSGPDSDEDIAPDADESAPMSMKRARALLNMEKHSLNDLLDTLVEAGPEGTLSRGEFLNCLLLLVRLGGSLDARTDDYQEASELLKHIYSEFDTAGNDLVDLSQLTSGLSILCSVPLSAKIDFAFALYDLDDDGFVAYSELVEYMASVFKVLFVTSPELKGMLEDEITADQLADITASQAFSEAGLTHRSKLSKATFETFVARGLGLS